MTAFDTGSFGWIREPLGDDGTTHRPLPGFHTTVSKLGDYGCRPVLAAPQVRSQSLLAMSRRLATSQPSGSFPASQGAEHPFLSSLYSPGQVRSGELTRIFPVAS